MPACIPFSRCVIRQPVILCLGLVLIVTGAFAQSQLSASDPVLEQYIESALGQNPKLRAAELRRDASEQKVLPAGALSDPMLIFGLKEYPLRDDPTMQANKLERSGKWLGLEQEFPFPGIRSARREVARSEWRMQEAMAAGERAMLIAEVKILYYKWSRIRTERALLLSTVGLLQQMSAILRSEYASGMGELQKLSDTERGLAEMQAELTELAAQEAGVIAGLRARCQIPQAETMVAPAPLEVPDIEIPGDSLEALIADANPELRVSKLREAMADAEVRMADRERFPMFRLGAEYMRIADPHEPDQMSMVSLMGGVTLPVFAGSRQNPLLRSKLAERSQGTADRENAEASLQSQVDELIAMQESVREQLESYRERILPSARRAAASAELEFRAGQGELMELLDARMKTLDAERKLAGLYDAYLAAWAEIESLTGQRLF